MSIIAFPGQGSQFPGMTKDLYENFKVAREIFELISDITKLDIIDLIFNNPDDLLNQTQYTQISIFSASMSIYKVLESEVDLKANNFEITYMLGHSLGEYTALAASNKITISDCALLLKKRGVLMQESCIPNKSGMVAIIGLDCNKVENIILENKLEIEIANDNSPLQIVISGLKTELTKSEDFFIQAGAKKFLSLNVSAAFHSKLMIEAESKMKEYIKNIKFIETDINIISNYNANISNKNDIIVNNLSKQMSNRVRWVESIKLLESKNITNVIEIGPGRVLGGLIKRISGNFNIKNIEKTTDIKNFNL